MLNDGNAPYVGGIRGV